MRNHTLNEGNPLHGISLAVNVSMPNGAPTCSWLRAFEFKGVAGSTPGTLSRLKVGAPVPQRAEWATVPGCALLLAVSSRGELGQRGHQVPVRTVLGGDVFVGRRMSTPIVRSKSGSTRLNHKLKTKQTTTAT
jgi:hypothetical protein